MVVGAYIALLRFAINAAVRSANTCDASPVRPLAAVVIAVTTAAAGDFKSLVVFASTFCPVGDYTIDTNNTTDIT